LRTTPAGTCQLNAAVGAGKESFKEMLVEVAVYLKLNEENGGRVHGVSISQEHNADVRGIRFTGAKRDVPGNIIRL
jgi:hypothetical protein